ncbi:MAG TPA: hypothetical protein VFU15_02705 [Bacteroidia bacterium]|nr:hypothetical protein [Bacteroidia bacterium]
MSVDHGKEALVLGKYLLGGKIPDEKSVSLYVAAHQKKPVSLDAREEKIFAFLLRHPRCCGVIDSALAVSNPHGGIRRKIMYMSAILEARPAWADLFLPRERSFFYNLFIFWIGARALLKIFAGKILLAFV